MRRVALVGANAGRWTDFGAGRVYDLLVSYLADEDVTLVSGACPYEGVDYWAEQMADRFGRKKVIYAPKTNNWEGYKARNIKIAMNSDLVVGIVPDLDPLGREVYCYHCKKGGHVKSGACWTVRRAKWVGVKAGVVVVPNFATMDNRVDEL